MLHYKNIAMQKYKFLNYQTKECVADFRFFINNILGSFSYFKSINSFSYKGLVEYGKNNIFYKKSFIKLFKEIDIFMDK